MIVIGLNEGKKLKDIIKIGLKTMRELILYGYTEQADYPYDYIAEKITDLYGTPDSSDDGMLVKKLRANDLADDMSLAEFLNARGGPNSSSGQDNDLFEKCKKIVSEGPLTLDVPYLRFGNLLTFDRTEIGQLRSIYQVFKLYISTRILQSRFPSASLASLD